MGKIPGTVLRLLTAAAMALSFGAPSGNAAEDVPGDVAAGRMLADSACARCHNVRRNGGPSPLPDAPAFQSIADIPATTQLSLRVFLQSSHRLMPDLHLTAQERDDVITYVLSLKKK